VIYPIPDISKVPIFPPPHRGKGERWGHSTPRQRAAPLGTLLIAITLKDADRYLFQPRKRLFRCGRACSIGGQPGSRTLNLASRVNSQHVTFARFQLLPAEPDLHLSTHPALQKLSLYRTAAILYISLHVLLSFLYPFPVSQALP
jgi:hypothetical protein